jgi:exonuclease III
MQQSRVAPEKHQPSNTDVLTWGLSCPSHFTRTRHTQHDVCLSFSHVLCMHRLFVRLFICSLLHWDGMGCLRKNFALTTQAILVQKTPHTIKGRLLAVRLETSGPPIILFSIYWPSIDSTSALQQRDNIAVEINQVINSQRCIPIILGDMNATFEENDRSSLFFYRKDAHYQKVTQDNHFVPIDYNLAKRPWTFSMCTSSALNSHTTTRLDDILLPSALVTNQRHPQLFCYPDDRGCKHSDLIPLIANIPLSSLGQSRTSSSKHRKLKENLPN